MGCIPRSRCEPSCFHNAHIDVCILLRNFHVSVIRLKTFSFGFRLLVIKSLNRQRLLRIQIRMQDPAPITMQDLQSGHQVHRTKCIVDWDAIMEKSYPEREVICKSASSRHPIRRNYSRKTKYTWLNQDISFPLVLTSHLAS